MTDGDSSYETPYLQNKYMYKETLFMTPDIAIRISTQKSFQEILVMNSKDPKVGASEVIKSIKKFREIQALPLSIEDFLEEENIPLIDYENSLSAGSLEQLIESIKSRYPVNDFLRQNST